MVHRAIDHIVYHKQEQYRYTEAQAEEMNKQCSMTERRAETASREVDARLKCLFMQQFIGDEMVGTVSGVTRFGLFVQLEKYQVDGLIHVTSLPNDYYHHDPIKHQLTGERGGNLFRLTDQIAIKIAAVDLDDRKIDFDYVGKLNAKGEIKKHNSKNEPTGSTKKQHKNKKKKEDKPQKKGKSKRQRNRKKKA